ncbi:unnamed protein product, partial [Laminaria digitata]
MEPRAPAVRRRSRRNVCEMETMKEDAHVEVEEATAEGDVHPGPSDYQLERSARLDGSTPIYASPSPSQEDRDLARALVASLATATPSWMPAPSAFSSTLSSSTTSSCSASSPRSSPKKEAELGSASDQPAPAVPPPGDFFWVDSDWLRQWVTGEHCPAPLAEATPLLVSLPEDAAPSEGKGVS